jgi:hypothetical protein
VQFLQVLLGFGAEPPADVGHLRPAGVAQVPRYCEGSRGAMASAGRRRDARIVPA